MFNLSLTSDAAYWASMSNNRLDAGTKIIPGFFGEMKFVGLENFQPGLESENESEPISLQY